MQFPVQILYEGKAFDFECANPTDLKGRLLLTERQREWLRARQSREDDADLPWDLDENGERLPEDKLFDRSPWALAGKADGPMKLLNRLLNFETGEAWFQLPEQYGGEWFRWMREQAAD